MPDIEFSPQQKAIFAEFKDGKGNVVIRARAGTGKTFTVVNGIEFAPESKILMAAFNKKIAEELKTRLRNPNASAKTLHSVGCGFIYRNWTNCQLDNERGERLARAAAGPKAPDAVINLIKKLAALGKNSAPFPTTEKMVDIAYSFDVDPDEWIQELGWTVEVIADNAIKAMDLACQKDGTMDFDDMVFVPVKNGWVRPTYDLVVIDEAQDMNASQLMLAMGVRKKNGRIIVVGDDRQAIYGFRGADSNSLDRLKGELVAKELGLTITYRCPKKVVALAVTIVPDYKAADAAPDGDVSSMMFEKMLDSAAPGDFILSRVNAPLARTCLRLIRMNKRAMVEGREIGAGLKFIVSKIKGKSIPEFLEKLTKWEDKQILRLRKTKKASAEKKIEFIKDQAETLRAISEGVTGLSELSSRIDSMFQETVGGKLDYIVCSSVHKSKGLERDRVFGLTETLYPGGIHSIEEENIHYVMVTRAKKSFVSVTGAV